MATGFDPIPSSGPKSENLQKLTNVIQILGQTSQAQRYLNLNYGHFLNHRWKK